jgi:hypothetical protein
VLLAAWGLFSGCRTPLPHPRVDLTDPGWQIRRGQALWKPSRTRPEIAGELLIATHPDGRALVEWTKPPVTLVTAGVTREGWYLEFKASRRDLHGRGGPPARTCWLVLPRALEGVGIPEGWTFAPESPEGMWILSNAGTGESLRGYLFP